MLAEPVYRPVGADAVLDTIDVAAMVMLPQLCVHIIVSFAAMVLVDIVIIEDGMLLVIVAPIMPVLIIIDDAVAILPIPVADDAVDAIEAVPEVDVEATMAEDCICAAGEAVIPLPDDPAEYALQSMLTP